MKKTAKRSADTKSGADILAVLRQRFEKNLRLHKGIKWETVQARLEKNNAAVKSLEKMEGTGGQPDVVDIDKKTGRIIFMDCSVETPAGRKSICYDDEALKSRKEFKPKTSAMAMAKDMGIDILTEEQYMQLQALGEFDLKTSSWLKTPPEVRKNGGAIFGDRRYGRVFVYHNGAESYYGVRGFRGVLEV